MNCSIKGTLTSNVLTASRNVEPGYFDTPAFIEQFGEWRPSMLSEAQIDMNTKDVVRFYEDGSPRIDVNKYGNAFYTDKEGIRRGIHTEDFSTLPLEVRSEVSEEIMNAVVADLLLDHLADNDEFLSGEKMEGFDLSDYFDGRVIEYANLGMTQLALDSVNASKEDYMDGIEAKLRNLGVKVENDAIKQQQSIQRPTTDKASPTIKAIMQFVPRVDSSGERIDSANIPNKATYMKPSEVWGVVLEHMADLPMQKDKDMVEVYLTKLEELSITHPWAEEILDKIDDAGRSVQVQFVTALNNVRNNINITEFTGAYSTKNATAASTSRQKVVAEWTTIFRNTREGMSKEAAENIAFNTIPTAQDKLDNIGIPEDEEGIGEALVNMHAAIAPVFDAFNIGIEENTTVAAFGQHVQDLYQGKAGEVDYLDAYKSFANLLNDSWLPAMGAAMQNPTEANVDNYANALVKFGDGQVNVEDDSGVHMVTVGKNRIYIYSLPSVLQETLNDWKNNPNLVKDLANDPSIENSLLIQHLANPNNLAQLTVGMRGVVTTQSSTGRRDAHDGGDISKGDYAKVDFYNVLRMLGEDNKHSPIYNTQVPADKGKEFQLDIPNFFTEFESNSAAASAFRGYVKNEFAQMRSAVSYISNVIDEKVAEQGSALIEQFFADKIPGQTSAEILSNLVAYRSEMEIEDQALVMELVEEVKKPLTVNFHLQKDTLLITDLGSDKLGQYVGNAFKYTTADSLNQVEGLKHPVTGLPLPMDSSLLDSDKKMSDEIQDVLEKAVSNKINKFVEEAETKYGISVSPKGTIEGIDPSVWNYYKSKFPQDEFQNGMAKSAMMRDFVANYMISKIEYSHLFTGDLSYYKHVADYIKRVPATYVDGLQPVIGLEQGDESFTMMTFATEGLDGLELSYDKNLAPEVRSHYAEVDRTDAQGYITPNRWRQLILSVGKMSPEASRVFEKIVRQSSFVEKGQEIPEDAMLSAKEVKILSAQPLKGVYFKNEIGGSPVYLKYSQAVLLPQFVANNPKAAALLEYMEDNGIDEMVAQTGVKVGAKRPATLFNKEGQFVAPANPVLQTLDSRNWRLQQDLPTKLIKDNKIGVQVMKIIMSGLAFSGDQTLLQEIEDSLADLSDTGLKDFYRRYGISTTDGSAKITDTQIFYEALLKDMQSKEVPENNIVRALKAETPISLLPMLKEPLQNQIFSALRKAATNLMTPGGAGIQISDQLIGKTEIERRGITMLVDSLDRLMPPQVTTYTASDGTEHSSVKPGQVLIPHAMIAKFLPDYQNMSPAELRSAIPKELREMIGYRIPTQAKASVDILEIVGILPIELGDSIITYGEITAKTGSDFDIDKMFFMMHEMIMLNEGITKATKGLKGKRNKVIDLFKRVLKDPKYYNEMMTSVDNDTFKEGTLSLLDKRNPEDMDAWDPVRAIDTRFAYRTGGSGVAVSANSLSDHVLTQAKQLRAEFNQGKWGNEYLDQQASERLSDEQLMSLLSTINAKRKENGDALMSEEEAEARLRTVAISGTLSELTNAFVDIANEDAFVTRGNWGDITNGYGMMMVRQGIHPNKVSAILRQPALVELVEAITNKEGLIDNTPAYELEEEIMVKWKVRAQSEGLTGSDISFVDVPTHGALDWLDFDSMLDSAVTQSADGKAQLKNQLIVLKHFIASKNAVKKYNSFVTNSKNDAKGAGRNAADMFVRTNKFSDSYFFEEPAKGKPAEGIRKVYQKFFDDNGNTRLSYAMYNNTVGVATKIMNDNPMMFDSIGSQVFEMFNRAAAQNLGKQRVDTIANAEFLFNEFAAYKMSGFGPISKEDTKTEEEGFIQDIIDLKASRKYELLNKLLVNANEEGDFSLGMERLAQKSPESKNSLTNSWRLILQDFPALGDYLVRKAYRQSNFQPGPNQFHELIPFEWFLAKDYLGYVHADNSLPTDDFLRQAVRKENATEFFKFLKAGLVGNHYITRINDDVARMGKYGKNPSIGRMPKFAVTSTGGAELLGTVQVATKDPASNKTAYDTFALYSPLTSLKETESAYNNEHGKDDLTAEADIDWRKNVREVYQKEFPNSKITIRDISDLSRKVEGKSFFIEPGDMVDLEVQKGIMESKSSDGLFPEQMCGM